jgi:hypothetical protein
MSIKVLVDTLLMLDVQLLCVFACCSRSQAVKAVGLTRFCLHEKLISSFCSFSIMGDWEFKNLLYSLFEKNESR